MHLYDCQCTTQQENVRPRVCAGRSNITQLNYQELCKDIRLHRSTCQRVVHVVLHSLAEHIMSKRPLKVRPWGGMRRSWVVRAHLLLQYCNNYALMYSY